MLQKKSLVSSFKLSGLALGLCLLPLSAPAVFAQSSISSSGTISDAQIPTKGLRTAVVAATDTGGDTEIALRALKAATIALGQTPGYIVMPANKVAGALQKANMRWPFAPREYPEIRKKLDKADRIVAITVSPTDVANTYSALVEMYDTNNGGLVGRGEGTYTATADSIALVNGGTVTTTAPEAVLGSFSVPEGTALEAPTTDVEIPATIQTDGIDATFLAVDGAVLRAMSQMNEPAAINGIIVSLPGGYLARLSKGEMHGLRNGARIEYTVRGRTIAYGTAVDVGKGDALATVAPERAFPLLELNGEFRSVNNPVRGTAGRSRDEFDAGEWRKFENQFGLAAGIAAVGYLLYTGIL